MENADAQFNLATQSGGSGVVPQSGGQRPRIRAVQLGSAYDDGDGVPDDKAAAVAWYRKAASKGT
jgi:TPR repeat protein